MMRQRFPRMGLGTLCRRASGRFGRTRSAYYEQINRTAAQVFLAGLVLSLVAELRAGLPMLGTRKLLHLLTPRLGEYERSIGRDYLFDLLATHGLLIRYRRQRMVTTQACRPLYRRSNLIELLVVERPEQVWVSDITYIRLAEGWCYLNLITDL